MPEETALDWFRQIVSAVAHCHAHGAAHGQLRPENVLIRDGKPELIGFYCCADGGADGGAAPEGGEAAAAHAPAAHAPSAPDPSVALRAYLPLDAPELMGRATACVSELRAGDVWALGVLLIQMLTGRPEVTQLN